MKIYITNLGKYVEGELIGKWIDLPVDDMVEELKDIGVAPDTQYEEAFITDYEAPIYIHEYDDLDTLNEVAEEYACLKDFEKELIQAGYEAGVMYNLADLQRVLAFQEYDDWILENASSFKELAMQLVDEGGYGDIPESLVNYIDYEAIGNDLRGYYTETSVGMLRSD